MPEPQVRDVAALAGVSAGTVSNALNHPAKVSPATLARVHAAIEQLGFVRNEAGHRLRRGVNRTIGMLVLDVANPFFTDVAHGVEDGLLGSGHPLILGNSAQDLDRERTYLDAFDEQRLCGALVTPVGHDLERLRRLRDRGTAVVLVDRMSRTRDFSSVAGDDRVGGRLAAQHLLDTGRRRILFVGGPATIAQVSTRLRAARAAVARVPGAELEFLESADMGFEAGRRAVEEVLARPAARRPDALMGANDLVALGALQALTLAGVAVPGDVALVGYDDIQFAASAAIPLTSVRQPAHAIGATAAAMLLEQIDRGPGEDDAGRRHVSLKPELVVRRSSVAS